jgi:iron complex transport system substrate-binding protein
MSRIRAAYAALVILPLVLAACGQAASSSSSTAGPAAQASPSEAASGGFPVTLSTANGEVTLEAQPTNIVSLSPTATEMLFAVGAGQQVTAVDEFSNHPSEAPTTDLSGFDPNIETIAGYEPDLVVTSDETGEIATALEEVGVGVLTLPAAVTLDDSYEQIEQLGKATGHADEAAAVAEQMRDDIDKIAADLPELDQPLRYYHELDDTYYSVTSDTFIGQIYGLLGLRNIADEAPDDAGGYPQLSSEFIVDANPDLIFLADTKCCGQSAETVAQRAGWDRISAVTSDGVVALDDDIASRWGPRVVDLLRTVADAVQQQATSG